MVSGTKITALSEMPANSGSPSMAEYLKPWVPKYLTANLSDYRCTRIFSAEKHITEEKCRQGQRNPQN
jgi:hypothetical protein